MRTFIFVMTGLTLFAIRTFDQKDWVALIITCIIMVAVTCLYFWERNNPHYFDGQSPGIKQ